MTSRLRATAVTSGVGRTSNKSQHKKLAPGENSPAASARGIEPATSRSRQARRRSIFRSHCELSKALMSAMEEIEFSSSVQHQRFDTGRGRRRVSTEILRVMKAIILKPFNKDHQQPDLKLAEGWRA